MKKLKIWGILCMLICVLCMSGTLVRADEDAGYVYENIAVNVDITEKREYRITETMDIDFEDAMHGIVRDLPKSGNAEGYSIRNIQVEGMPFQVDERQNNIAVRIGDENKLVQGKKRIVLSYTLKHYQDYDQTYDYAYLNLLGTDYDTEVRKFQAEVSFPAKERLLDYKITSGSRGSHTNTYTKETVKDNLMVIQSTKTLPARHGVTLQLKYEEGVFSAAPEYQFPYVIKKNVLDVTVTPEQDIQVTQKISIQTLDMYTRIYLPMLCDLWDRSDYKIEDIELSDADMKYNEYDSLTAYARKKGEHSYTIRYTIHPYRLIKDSFTLNLFKQSEDTKLENMTLRLHMPYAPAYAVRTGRDNDVQQDNWTGKVDGTTVTIHTTKEIRAAESFVVTVPVESGYFKRDSGGLIKLGGLLCAGFMGLLAFLRFGIFRKKQLIIPVNFYPPKGMNPAEAGYVIDNDLSVKDMTALLFYWADKGYLKIRNIDSSYSFEKIQAPDSSAPMYEQHLFERMFAHGKKGIVGKEDLKYTFYMDIRDARKELLQGFQGEYALRSQKVEALRKLLMLLSLVPLFLLNALAHYEIYGDMLTAVLMSVGLLPILAPVMILLMLYRNYKKGAMAKGAMVAVTIILGGFTLMISPILLLGTTASAPYTVLGIALTLVAYCMSCGIHKDSAYRQRLLSQLLGFRDFIKTVEKERLELLLKDDPEYYYHVLPYAQVLHVSDIWEHKFHDITLQAPQWYDSSETMDSIMFYHMVHEIDHDMRSVATPPASSSSSFGYGGDDSGYSGGGGGFSDGGFSGGGSGGGGSHGW